MSKGYELYAQGRAAIKAGQTAEAVRLLRKSAALQPHFKTFELLGECMVKFGKHAEAVEPLASAIPLNRGPRAPALLAEVCLALGRTKEAREYAELALARHPQNRKAKLVLVKLGVEFSD